MARTTGPLFSQSASGTLASALTFSTWKGRSICKRASAPSDPNSPLQRSVRAVMSFLNQAWSTDPMTDAKRDAWLDLAARTNTSTKQSFITWNLDRWTRFLRPQQTPTATGTNLTPFWTQAPIIIGGKGLATIEWDYSNRRDAWGLSAFSTTPGPLTDGRDTLIAAYPLNNAAPQQRQILRLNPGVYTYHTRTFNGAGATTAVITSSTFTVT